jgi:hypothetical protein
MVLMAAPPVFALDIAPGPIRRVGISGILLVVGAVLIAAALLAYLLRKKR